MNRPASPSPPPDLRERERALDAGRSFLVQAPAGSGKTDLLTRRFMRLLGEVGDPSEIVAITFTKAAAAEMRHRIVDALEEAALGKHREPTQDSGTGDFEMPALARRALQRSQQHGWDLLHTPAQLRISTIDSFCREIALQKPLLSDLGGGIAIHERPSELYLRAARRTLEQIDQTNSALSSAIARLLEWRDNNWQELERQLVEMLGARDRWMHDFVLDREPNWDELRERLERPFANAVRDGIAATRALLDQIPGARKEAHELARFACGQTGGRLHRELADLAEFPCGPLDGSEDLESARLAYVCLADLLLTDGAFRRRVDKRHGFPTERKAEKNRMLALIDDLKSIDGFASALGNVSNLPPARYSEDEWQIVRACFVVLRHAAGELRVAFAEAGNADFIEVAQSAQAVLTGDDGLPADPAQCIADGIRHLLVDEFQDTSRRQHKLLAGLVAAWPEREGRTLFAVGDPMQSIYFFRDADAELFPRVRNLGLEVPNSDPLPLEFVPLRANFRTAPALVEPLNKSFSTIFAEPDGSGIPFAPALAQRPPAAGDNSRLALHLEFAQQSARNGHANRKPTGDAGLAREEQTGEIVELIRIHLSQIAEKLSRGEKHYRLAVLARTKKSLQAIAAVLRDARIRFRAVELEGLAERPEVRDAIALARALFNPEDRVAWLGVLRAPWCGLTLHDLHTLVSCDDKTLLARPVSELLAERLSMLSAEGQIAAQRVHEATSSARGLRTTLPNASLGTWLEQVWLRLGGADCVDAAGRTNLGLLWRCLDRLPNGEQDLLGPSLDAALDKLTALPDPAAGSDTGVQLMTIHKAKGLEFEVVIVPDLQAHSRRSKMDLLSWLERGVATAADHRDSGEPTEFLIAPVQSKGAERGAAKRWVDRLRRDREAQEDRRILYVAATRAREELHLFARPEYKVEDDGSLTLNQPKNSLLATAWPALEDEIRDCFATWTAKRRNQPQPGTIEQIAAEAQIVEFLRPARPTPMRRLPANYQSVRIGLASPALAPSSSGADTADPQLYERHEGGIVSRAFGRAVHRFMEELARLRLTQEWDPARSLLRQSVPRIAADLRAAGLGAMQSSGLAAEALDIALRASRDPVCQWILSPHADAASEVRWVGVVQGTLRTVQIDRIFRAGEAPSKSGASHWWIIDFKTHGPQPDFDPAAALSSLRALFAPQLQAYAAVLRNLHGEDTPVRAGLYYPRMLLFDDWEL